MPVLSSTIDTRGQTFATQRAQMLALVEQFRELEAKVRAHSAEGRAKSEARGQLLPRERVDRLLDRGSPFLELSPLAGYKMHDDDGKRSIAGGSTIIGIGFVAGRRCIVSASDSAIKGGAISPMGLRKSLRAQEVALHSRLPCISLIESAGANLLYQSELFVEGGRVFANMARLSAAGLPQITVVHGSSTAGGAYIPGLSDYVIVVKERSRIFLAGPPLVKAALGEDADEETLGGAVMHTSVSGTAEYLAQDDAHALELARELLGKLPWDEDHAVPGPGAPPRPPRFNPEELLGVVPVDYRQPYDVHEVIARIVDDSDFLDFKPAYGPQTVCGHARIEGQAVGIIGNNGPIFPQGAAKAGHFIQACCQSGTPIVYLQNTTGYMVGTEAEAEGIVKHGAKMIQAVANATVPQLTILLGGSFGAGNYGMCGRSFDPRFIFAWPNARISVMGGEQAAKVMEIITRANSRQGVKVGDLDMEKMTGAIRDKLDAEAGALFATARLWDDGVIDPRDTRRVLATALAICREAEARRLRPNTFGVARLLATTQGSNVMKFTEEHEQLRDTLTKFIDREINPYADEWEAAEIFPAHALFKKLGDAGFLGVSKPEEYGGMGLDYSYSVVMAETLGRVHTGGVAMAIGVQTDMCTPALAKFASKEMKEQYLAPSIAGDIVGCIGVSEPEAGSDVAAIRTHARKDGGDWVINGGKMWITNGWQADWMCCLANTSDGNPHRNKSLLIIPMDAKGVERARKLKKIGMASSDTAQIFFDDVRIPLRNMIGQEGHGFTFQMLQFQEERLWGAANVLGGLDQALAATIEYARDRKIFGQSVLDHQYVHFKLAEVATEVECLRALLYQATELYISGKDVTKLASMAKLKAGRLAREAADTCLQFWGGMGYMHKSKISRFFRDGRLVSIGGGADEVMMSIICKLMGTLPRREKAGGK